jgi:hypothetical protein
MKTKINIFKLIFASLAVVTFFSCENPIGLGQKLDIEGPVVTIVSPTQRQSVLAQFTLKGTVQDSSGVDRMIIKAVSNNQDFPRQWRYQNGAWEISDNYGTAWLPFADGVWTSTNGFVVTWEILIDMKLSNQKVAEGEYTFNVQAWDKGGFTDDNSFKALVLIIDQDPPKVVITNPYLYSKYAYDDPAFVKLDNIPDTSDEWQDPAYLGKFITQEFSLKWQIEDLNDVWSINLSFYTPDTEIDNDPDTPLPDNYIYRYYKNTPPPPSGANPNDYVKLNGSVTVPNLYGASGTYDNGELKNPATEKTTVKVVAVCYDAAGNPNQEKTLGYFISWPRANTPWIVFTEGLQPPDNFYDKQTSFDEKNPDNPYIEDLVFTVYPGRSVKATAFQAHGVKEVKYSLYECDISGNILHTLDLQHPFKTIEENVVIPNTPYGGTYSTIFPWELQVPPFTGYYVFTAEAFSSQDIKSEKYVMLFRVHDITFPDFTEGPYPIATEPLFMSIINNKITVHGIVSDATEVVSLCMVWINPESEGFAAMSQLSYFRNSNYPGWKEAIKLAPGESKIEEMNIPEYGITYPYDREAPNRLWKLNLASKGIDYDTNRHLYEYTQTIDITADLKIGPGSLQSRLKSQVLLFRAQNPDGKCTVITYAPQGDTLAPVISISDVIIKSGSNPAETYFPNTYKVIPQFENGDTITINGTWWEDSAAYMPMSAYFLPNFKITVNNQELPPLNLANIITGSGTAEGTWTITTTVGSGQVPKDKLKDTLVIGVKARDIGGNEAEAGSSWLIQSDNLRLMRISSEAESGIYKQGDKIDIFLEFSKPVKLTNGVIPDLILSSDTGINARAAYKGGQENQNSRQYFEYTVGAGHKTNTGEYLNVKNLFSGNAFTTSTPYNTPSYPFTWSRGTGDDYEEVRVTMIPGKNSTIKENGYYVHTLPTTANSSNPDYQFTLTAGKHIEIDTTPPTVAKDDGVKADTNPGHYSSGDIYITVTFSKAVTIGAVTPQLVLDINGNKYTDTANVRVNGKTITFMYRITSGDTTLDNPVRVTGFTGNITDLAGNALSGAISQTLEGLYIDTIAITSATPTLRVLRTASISDVLGVSGGSAVDIKNIYDSNIYFAIQAGNTTWHKLGKLEYSINGGSWIEAPNIVNTPFTITSITGGSYTITARQINRAESVSNVTNDVKFNWDPGNIISRISSTDANGTYTNTKGNGGDRQDTVNITVYFRKQVKFSTATPSITLNTTPVVTVSASGYIVNSLVSQLTFNYQVGENDITPSGQKLNVTNFGFGGSTAQDEANVTVNDYLGITHLTGTNTLSGSKDIYIQTGALNRTAIAFNNGSVTGGSSGTQADGSYNTALVLTFDRNAYKGNGYITIIQQPVDYRLPTVLNESQFSKYNSTVENINTYYMRGSNGYIYNSASDRKPDTSTKYILKYDVNTAAVGTPSGSGTAEQKLAEAFRQAEKIELSVNSQAVRVSGNQLIVELTGANALQVPGATYQVYYSKGFVQDSLNTPCLEVTNGSPVSVALPGGVAKPFIRINKRQDTITVADNPSLTQPRLVAVQPFQADVRMDTRTPGSMIYYFATYEVTSTDAMNWNYNANPAANGPGDLTIPAAPGRPSDPQTTTSNRQTYNATFTIGTDNDYQGLQWYVRAKSSKGSEWSADSEEMAFKTVITYVIINMNTAQEIVDTGIRPASGDQIWIRGGDAILSSSVPGFPITWDTDEFDKINTDKKRAGIRLFTNTATTTDFFTNSTWKWITWEINVDTYFDIILGRDASSAAAEALQYGPRQWAYQRAGWTAYKEQFRALPGKHRWLVSNNPSGGDTKGTLNFSGTFNARAQYTGSGITYPPSP